MTITVTDLFCGAGGTSIGAEAAGMTLVMAANHWATAIEVHQTHFPAADHDLADISQADPRRYPVTDVLLASPECTNHSSARGVSRKRQDPSLWDAPDPTAERSRATMWDVPRFAEQNRYQAIVVENVVEATKWVGWRGWHQVMADLGYQHRVLSHNSSHHGVPQSRDRIYVVFWQGDLNPDLELELDADCASCGRCVARQGWKNGRTVGKHGPQYVYVCTGCGRRVVPPVNGADTVIDWSIPCTRIGDRTKPLADATRKRIAAGIAKWWPESFQTAVAGATFERVPGSRSRLLSDPVPTQQTTATTGMVTPPGWDALVMRNNTGGSSMLTPVTEPVRTVTANGAQSLVVPWRRNGKALPVDRPVSTVTAGGNHHALVMSYYGNGNTKPSSDPISTQGTRDTSALIAPVHVEVDDCGLRGFGPPEVAAFMAFPKGYIPTTLTKRDQVKLAGNAVTPPVMQWITGRLLQAMEA